MCSFLKCLQTINLTIDCRNSTTDNSYNGKTSVTRTGKECIPWSESASTHTTQEENYCRTPTGHSNNVDGPWCYINNTLGWETCNVPVCGGKFDQLK